MAGYITPLSQFARFPRNRIGSNRCGSLNVPFSSEMQFWHPSWVMSDSIIAPTTNQATRVRCNQTDCDVPPLGLFHYYRVEGLNPTQPHGNAFIPSGLSTERTYPNPQTKGNARSCIRSKQEISQHSGCRISRTHRLSDPGRPAIHPTPPLSSTQSGLCGSPGSTPDAHRRALSGNAWTRLPFHR